MNRLLPLFLLLITSSSHAYDWPQELVNKTYAGCMKNGGTAQCECLVTRLQHKFTFEDLKLAMSNKLANQALQQAIESYNMKCLEADFKKETALLKQQR